MFLPFARHHKVHLIGISGAEGSSVASFLLKQGYTNLVGHDHVPESGFKESFFRFHDWMTEDEKETAFSKFKDSGIAFHFEDTYLADIGEEDIIFVPQSWFRYGFNEPLRKYFGEDLRVREEFKDRIWSMTKLYLELFPGKVIGVTGSNGKSTTTAMVAAILKKHLERMQDGDGFRPSSPQRGEELEVRGLDELLLLERAKTMRSVPTEAEQKLWSMLRDRSLEGYQFKRQKPISPYIVDFVCLEKKIIVEVDGSQQAEEPDEQYDQERTTWLETKGYTVLRFWNNEVLEHPEGVWTKILEKLKQTPHPRIESGAGSPLFPLGRGEIPDTPTQPYSWKQGKIPRLYWGGNDRKNPQPLDEIGNATEHDILLLEMSNRQLSLGLGKSPNVAVITNVVPNHLDDHGTFEAYVRVKEEIVRYQTEGDTAVLNWNNAPSRQAKDIVMGSVVFFDLNPKERPVAQGFIGARREGTELVAYHADGERRVMASTKDVGVPGEHNVENALAAIAAVAAFDISAETVRSALRGFGGLDHRLELVTEKDGVKYVNDSSGCSPLNIVMAVRTLLGDKRPAPTPPSHPFRSLAILKQAQDRLSDWQGEDTYGLPLAKGEYPERSEGGGSSSRGSLILILGGYRKNPLPGEFLPVAEVVKDERVKHLYLIGSIQETLEKEFLEGGVEVGKITRCPNLEEAFVKAKDMAQSGDTVALTPGCESFGEFRDYRERGERFRELVLQP